MVDQAVFRRVVESICVRKLIFAADGSEQTAAAVSAASPILAVAKTASLPLLVNDTVLADDPELILTGIPSGLYAFDMRLRISSGASGSFFRMAMRTGPGSFIGNSSDSVRIIFRTGAGLDVIPNAQPVVFDNTPTALVWAVDPAINSTGRGFFTGFVRVPDDNMELALQWAQGVSQATVTAVAQESCMWLTRMADLP